MADKFKACSVEGCNGNAAKPGTAKGFCAVHYLRWRRHGDHLGGRTTYNGEPQRFYQDVVIPYDGDDCLPWPYADDGKGYGQIRIDGKMVRVIRVVCEETHGPPPTPKHEASHSCGKGHLGCVTKKHLSWKTRTENQADRLVHGTHNCGERHWRAKLTENDIREIRSLKGIVTQTAISARYGIIRQTVSDIQAGKRWGWLK